MTRISIIESLKKAQNERTVEANKLNRTFIDATEKDFNQLLKLKCERIFYVRNEKDREFDFDRYNQDFIRQMYFYLTGSKSFNGNLYKGIFLHGKYGVGKTVMMMAMSEMITEMTSKVVSKYPSKLLAERMNNEGVELMAKRPLFIDDIGREPELFNNFGTKKRVMVDLFFRRYDTGAWTFVTAQYPIDKFDTKYGKLITDRMKSMFNEIELPGESRRK